MKRTSLLLAVLAMAFSWLSLSPSAMAQCAPAWSATTAYNGGAVVSYNTINYTAAFWTQGQNPSTNNGAAGSGEPWISNGLCESAPTVTPTVTATVTPHGPPVIAPTPTATPALICGEPAWSASISYAQGALVGYNGSAWSAVAANKGVKPGSNSSDWTALGRPCTVPTPTVTPTPTATAPLFYNATALGNLGQGPARVHGINNHDQAVGSSSTGCTLPTPTPTPPKPTPTVTVTPTPYPPGVPTPTPCSCGGTPTPTPYVPPPPEPRAHAFLWSNGKMTDIGANSPYNGCSDETTAYTITNTGVVLGAASHWLGVPHAFIYSNGVFTDLGTTFSGIEMEISPFTPTGINNVGEIVGEGQQGQNLYGLLDNNGTLVPLSPPGQPPYLSPYSINDSGQIVGINHLTTVSTDGGFTYYGPHAFLYSNGVLTDLDTLCHCVGNFTSDYSVASAINNAGQVVGYSGVANSPNAYAFLYSNGQMIDLGDFGFGGSVAESINLSGQVSGLATGSANNPSIAFLYTNGKMLNVNSLIDPALQLNFVDAPSINDQGAMAATDVSGNPYLLTPSPPWQTGTAYATGTTVTYGGHVYRCLQGHTSQSNWAPPNVPALWQLVL